MTLSSAFEPFTAKLAWALIHFVWQGALVAFALKLVLSLPRLQTARVRYLLACGAMVWLTAAPVWTFLNTPAVAAPAMAARSGEALASPTEAPGAVLNEGLPPVIVRVQELLPRFRACQTITSARVANGETLVLTGFESAGKPGKGASASPPKPLIILVTPTLMDASGNRLPPK